LISLPQSEQHLITDKICILFIEFGDVVFVKVDVDKMRNVMLVSNVPYATTFAVQFALTNVQQAHKVRAMPTFVLLKKGEQVG
jgi:hypothetical protein